MENDIIVKIGSSIFLRMIDVDNAVIRYDDPFDRYLKVSHDNYTSYPSIYEWFDINRLREYEFFDPTIKHANPTEVANYIQDPNISQYRIWDANYWVNKKWWDMKWEREKHEEIPTITFEAF